jgi:hypothetical protein
MKTIMILIISFLSVQLYAPPSPAQITKEQSYQFTILTNPQFKIYYPLIKAIVYVESRGDTFAYNPEEGATGAFQVRQIRVDDYNKRTGSNYSLEDFYDYDLSRDMFLYYAEGKSFERAAKSWNGSGKLTIIYWNKVNQHLISQL